MNENQTKKEANKAIIWLIKYLEDRAAKIETDSPEFFYNQGLASGMRHAALMAKIQLESFNSIINLPCTTNKSTTR